MDDVIKYHGILQKMDKRDKIRLIQSLTDDGSKENLGLLFELLGDSIYEFRRAAAAELKKFGVDILDNLVELFNSGNSDQRYWCVQLMVELAPYSINALEMVLSCDESTLQQIAVECLARFKSKSSIRPLMNLFTEGNWAIRQAAFAALREFGEDISADCKDALKSENEDLVYWAVRLLGGMDYRHKKPLFKMMQEASPEMKFVVASALGEAGDTKILSLLVKCFKENSWIHSKRACDALAQVGPKAIPVILDVLSNEQSDRIYWYARTLLRLGEEGIEGLSNFLHGKGESFLWNCRDSLIKLDKDLIHLIAQLVLSSDRKMRFFAYQLAADLRQESCLDILIKGLTDRVWTCKKLCADALVQVGDSVIPVLKPLMTSSKYADMHWLIQVLSKVKGGETLLVDCLRRDSKDIVKEAAKALRNRYVPDAVLPLLNCLQDQEWLVRKEASDTLISFESLGLEQLVQALANDDDELQHWLTQILNSYPRSVYPYLTTLLYRKDYPAHLAARAMGIIGDEYFSMPLREALKEQDSLLVMDATWALDQINPHEQQKSVWGLLSQIDVREFPRLEKLVFSYREYAPEFISHGIDTNDSLLVSNCIHLVGRLQLKDMEESLTKRLMGKSLEHAILAAEAFMHLGDKSVLSSFHKMLEGEIENELRLKILSVIGAIAEEDVIYLILKMIQQSRSDAERTRFSQEVFRMGVKAIPQLISALGIEEIPVRKAAAELLLEFGALAVPYLQNEEASDDPNIRFWKNKILKSVSKKS